ncbi:pilus assembly protein [Sphingomonas sp. KR1UV-12]|uniref:Pilus assembly protein n=1 Tax=Sphingomonas aurea TaxID=3063994 RepID=A0ABT9EHI6_9SPHN|nr:TadE family protein [Sphingomonas sp. KR1UV-12]MDP1026436.1 pilus assembly protein [Sphingomonas sp. KR1UV-12]
MIRWLTRLLDDRRGASIMEFGLVVTPLMVMLMGAVDMGYQTYVRTVALGAAEGASRRILLEDADEATIETDTRAQIRRVISSATVNVETGSFFRYNNIDTMERLTVDLNGNGQLDGPVDTDGNGVPDKSDCWEDVDNNGVRNIVTVGQDGIGGADDIVKSTVTVTYPRLLPIWRLIGISDTATVVASTMVRRQPYENQAPPTIRCKT